jgi:acyl-CoA thioester hydrolase
MIEVWRGNANAWECDELGHMNVKFYLDKAMQGVANLAASAGLGNIFRDDARATLIPNTIHIKFLAESRPGAPLAITAGFTGICDNSADITLIMRHAGTGRIAASFRLGLAFRDRDNARDMSWPSAFIDQAKAHVVETPKDALPRGVTEGPPANDASLTRANEIDLEQIGMGRFELTDMDVFGRLRADVMLGRVSDSVVNFTGAFPEEWNFHQGKLDSSIGSALLETRILPRRWPRAGDGYVIRSGVKSVGPKIRNIVHWVLDPATGQPWWTMEGVAAPMDLDARKLVEPDAKTRARLEAAVKPGVMA